ncbi:MAG: hypothetical protein AAF802_12945 [Planctomycetota bacterium]
MKILIGVFTVAAVLESNADAQTVVQLPSFRSFSYSGSVLVPDRGATSLGSIRRSAFSQTGRNGLGHGFGGGQSVGGATAHVTIIDHAAIDAQIRGLSSLGAPSRIVRTHVNRDDEGKALVRYARKQYLAGQHASGREAYRIAIKMLSPKLSELARQECERVYPSIRR